MIRDSLFQLEKGCTCNPASDRGSRWEGTRKIDAGLEAGAQTAFAVQSHGLCLLFLRGERGKASWFSGSFSGTMKKLKQSRYSHAANVRFRDTTSR